MKKNNFSVLIPDGESAYSISVLRCLAQVPDVKVHLLAKDTWNMTRFSRYRSQFLVSGKDVNDEIKLTAIETAIRKTGADVILPVGIEMTRLVSVNRERILSLTAVPPISQPETIDLATDKSKLTKLLIEQEIPCPPTLFCDGQSVTASDLSMLAFPVLAKPVVSEGGRGIAMYDTPSTLLAFLNNEHQRENYIIQSYIDGYDMGCSVFCENGEILAHTMQKGLIPPYSRFAPPSGVDFFEDAQVYAIIKRLVRILNWSGVANIDFRFNTRTNTPSVLEINPRFWGSLLGSLIAGINFPYLVCLKALGMELPVLDYRLNRYIHHKAAIKIALKNLLPGEKDKIQIRGTGIEYILADPLPNVVKFFQDMMSGKLEM